MATKTTGGRKTSGRSKGKAADNGKVGDLAARRAKTDADKKAKADGKTVDERAAAGEHNEPEIPEPLIEGDRQLGFDVGGSAKLKVKEAELVITQKASKLDGLINPDSEATVSVRVKPFKYEQVPVRDAQGTTTHFKTRIHARPVWVERTDKNKG